jgi:uncharacterized protein (DUF4415 family)
MARENEDEEFKKLTTARIRDIYKQAQYRIESQSQQKESKQVAHYVSLRIAVEVLTKYRAVGRPPNEELKDVREFTHLKNNFRMVKKKTNDRHDEIDRALIDAAGNNEVILTKEQVKRASKQVSIIKATTRLGPDEGPILFDVTYKSFAKFYDKLKLPDSSVRASVWESVTSEDEVSTDSESEDESD